MLPQPLKPSCCYHPPQSIVRRVCRRSGDCRPTSVLGRTSPCGSVLGTPSPTHGRPLVISRFPLPTPVHISRPHSSPCVGNMRTTSAVFSSKHRGAQKVDEFETACVTHRLPFSLEQCRGSLRQKASRDDGRGGRARQATDRSDSRTPGLGRTGSASSQASRSIGLHHPTKYRLYAPSVSACLVFLTSGACTGSRLDCRRGTARRYMSFGIM